MKDDWRNRVKRSGQPNVFIRGQGEIMLTENILEKLAAAMKPF